jgi:hypothetical protein
MNTKRDRSDSDSAAFENDVDEFYEGNSVTEAMAAIGALVLLRYTELGKGAAITAARRMFCAMRAAEARQRLREDPP